MTSLSENKRVKIKKNLMNQIFFDFDVHQVYGVFNDGKSWEDIPEFKDNVKATKKFCDDNDYTYMMWSLEDCEKLLAEHYPEYIQLWNDFTYPVQRADFIRYCILNTYGGCYIDCDIRLVKGLEDIFQSEQYFVHWSNDKKKKPYNAVMGSKKNNPLFTEIIKEVEKSFYEKESMEIYKTWKGRFVFQTTGHSMLERVLKKQKIDKDKYLHDVLYIKNNKYDIGNKETALFLDSNASTWYG